MAGRTIVLPSYLDAVRTGTRQQLDRIGELVPPLRQPEEPLNAYLAKAQQAAASDPDFAARLSTALTQYKQLGG